MIKDEIIHFVYCMNQLTEAKIPLMEALYCCIDHMNALKKSMMTIIHDIEHGSRLSEALQKYPALFDHLFIKYVSLSEQTGKNYFHHIYQYLQLKQTFHNNIKKAFIYPAFIIGFLIILLYTLGDYVVPELLHFLKDQNQPIPLPTHILIAFTQYASYVLSIILGGLYLCTKSDYLILKIPMIGTFIKKYYLSLYFKITALFLNEKIPLVDALQYAKDAVANKFLQQQWEEMIVKLRQGQHLYEAIPYETTFVKIAERYGFLQEGFETLSTMKEKEVHLAIDMFIKVLEPTLIIILGAIIFMIVMAVWSPVYALSL